MNGRGFRNTRNWIKMGLKLPKFGINQNVGIARNWIKMGLKHVVGEFTGILLGASQLD